MVSIFTGGGAQEMTGFFFENNLKKGKKDNNPIQANNLLLVLGTVGIDATSSIKIFYEYREREKELFLQRTHKIHQVPDFVGIRDLLLETRHIAMAFFYFIK